MFLHEKTGKTASPRSIDAEDAMKKPRKRRRPRVRITLKEEAGRMLLDIGRMVFAGCAVVFLCNTFGLIMVKREIKPDRVKRLARRFIRDGA
jgi:hypothetical protein